MADRRKFSRVIYQAPALIKQGEQTWASEILDLSLKGALLATPPDWEQGNQQDYDITFSLFDSDIHIDMELRLIHENEHHLRFKIDHLDINSASHLKRLVELNVGNDALLHRELAQLTDLKDTV